MASNKISKELTKQEYAMRGIVAVMAVLLVAGLMYLKTSGTFGGPEHVQAQLVDAGGSLVKHADVKMNGVIVGHVSGIVKGPQKGVRVKLDIPADRLDQLPSNVVARILPATVFGTSYVDLTTHGNNASSKLKPNDVIPADKTQGTLELQQALDDIDRLTNALGPAELASAISSSAQALDGRGKQIGVTIDRLNGYLDRLNPKMPLVREDARKLSASIKVFNEISPDLMAATNDALVTTRTIVEQKAQIARLISGGTSLARVSGKFLRANEGRIIKFLNNMVDLLDVIYDNRKVGITQALATNRYVNGKLGQVLTDPNGDGNTGFARTLITVDLLPPPAYSPGTCLAYQGGAAPGSNCGQAGRASAAWMFGGAR